MCWETPLLEVDQPALPDTVLHRPHFLLKAFMILAWLLFEAALPAISLLPEIIVIEFIQLRYQSF